MVKNSLNNHLNKRRGISTIVGGIIFVVLLSAGFSTFFLAMEVQSDSMNAQKAMSNLMIEKTQEKFTVSAATDDSTAWPTLGIQVKNEGSNPVQVSNIWIINKSQPDQPAKNIPIEYNDAFIPPGYGLSILENQLLKMKDPTLTPGFPDLYDIKVVSALGTIKKVDLTVGANKNMRVDLIAIPPDVKVGQNVTLTLHVENIGKSRLLNVAPFGDYPNIVPPFTSPIPSAPKPVDLGPGEGVIFLWEYKTTGSAGSIVVFDSYVTALEEGSGFMLNSNVAVEKIELKEPDESEIIVLTQDLLARPGIFTAIPGPFGDDSEKAIWAVNIANPTPQPMYVNKIVFTAITTRGTGNDRIFNDGSCNPVTIPPTPPGTWTCPVVNQLMWTNLVTPALVPGYSVVSFTARMDPGSLSGGPSDVLEAIPIQTEVHTTLGQFGKTGYGTSMHNGGGVLANVYLTDNPGSTDNNDILLTATGIQGGTTVRLNATLADFDTGSSKEIDANARFIINIPKGWTNPNVVNSPGFTIQLPIQTYSDGSSQIVGILNNDLTGSGGVAQTIEFDVTAPSVTAPQMYVMYILADGTSDSGTLALGPLAEVVLQVVP